MESTDLCKLLERAGWVLTRTRGSHRQYTKDGCTVTVPHPKKDRRRIGKGNPEADRALKRGGNRSNGGSSMLYPVAVEAGDVEHAFGVVVPDLPGCYSAGDTFEEALVNARESIELHVEGLLDAGEQVPAPSPVDKLVADPDLKGFVWALIDVPAEALDSAVERVNVTIPRRVLHAIDQAAQRQHKSRSAYLAEAALFFDRVHVIDLVPPAAGTRPPKSAAKRTGKGKARA